MIARFLSHATLLVLAIVGFNSKTVSLSAADILVIGDTVYTMAGEPITNGAILIQRGKFAAIGKAEDLKKNGSHQVIRAKVVTPGLIDAHSTVGLSGMLNQPHDQEQVEDSDPMQPELRAIDAYNGRDGLADWIRNLGITTIHTGHGPGSLISGQTMIIKTDRENISDGVIRPLAMIAGALGESGLNRDNGSPGTRSKAVSLLRAEFIKTQQYQTKRSTAEEGKEPDRNLRLEILAQVLDRKIPFLMTAHRHQDILTAIRIAEEFQFRLILDGASEAHLVLDDIKEAGIPVLVHPSMARPSQDRENMTFEMAKLLQQAGIPFAQQSGFEAYVPKTRVVLFEAAMSITYGLSFEDALKSITINAAKILGIADRVGSIEVGKDADLALFDGDPFEFVTHCVNTIIDGKVVSDAPR
ncbi:MAG: amidohydrolase family protein [Verrucomicrobia bacterium]|jgi:imidazolonepropionase-like amidohydrolase|nr:amidohydrolase family protein [Verrucomicrobiota bacterium]MDA7667443.1 amidohydrolase family protein [bacterium]